MVEPCAHLGLPQGTDPRLLAIINSAYELALQHHAVREAISETVTKSSVVHVDSQLLVSGLHRMARSAEEAAHEAAIDAVNQRILTRAEASELLEVHPATVGRWVTQRPPGTTASGASVQHDEGHRAKLAPHRAG